MTDPCYARAPLTEGKKKKSWLLAFPETLENLPGTRKPESGYVCKVGMHAMWTVSFVPAPPCWCPEAKAMSEMGPATLLGSGQATAPGSRSTHAQTFIRAHGDMLPFVQGQR